MSTLDQLSTAKLQLLLSIYRSDYKYSMWTRDDLLELLENRAGKPTGDQAMHALKERLHHEEQVLKRLTETHAEKQLMSNKRRSSPNYNVHSNSVASTPTTSPM